MKHFISFIKEYGTLIVLLLAMAVAVVLAKWRDKIDTEKKMQHDTIVVRDTVVTVLPSPVVERFIPIDRVLERIDTVYIVKDYQMMRVYADTINTQYGQICIVDTIHQNTLTAQRVEYDLKFVPPDRTRSNTIAIGGGMSPMSAMATIQYRHKRWGYEGGYDFLQKAPMVKISYDLIRW